MGQNKGFFPIFLDVRRKNAVFIGGGRIASRRVGVMSEFDAQISVVSPRISPELEALVQSGRIRWLAQEFAESVLDQADMVLICTDDVALNHEIWLQCRQRHILANNCSNHEECDFYFPGVVSRDETVIAVNAGGKAHKKAAALRKRLAELLEKDVWNESDPENG